MELAVEVERNVIASCGCEEGKKFEFIAPPQSSGRWGKTYAQSI